jgi:hypothetical protein
VYYIAVRAYDNSPNRNISGYSAEAMAAPVADLPPAAPIGVTAAAGDTYIDIAWSASSATDLAGYRLYYGVAPGSHPNMIDLGNVLTTRLQSLVNGTAYYVVMTAYDLNDHESGISAEVSATPTVAPDTISPDAPVNLVAQPGDALVRLLWSANIEPDLNSYTVYWGNQPGVYSGVATNIVATSYQVNGLANGVRYYFSLRARDNAGNFSGLAIERSAVPNGVIPDFTPPAPPVNPETVTANQAITLSWSPNAEADLAHYNVRIGTVSGVYGAPVNTGTVTNFQFTGLVNGTTYYMVVTAVDTSNNESGYSAQVTDVPNPIVGGGDITPPGAPSSVTAVGRDSYVDLGWTNPGDLDFWGVKLYIGTSSRNYNVGILNLGNRTSYSVPLTNGVMYYLTLTAYDTSLNESAYGAEVTGLPTVSGGGGGNNPLLPPTNFAGTSPSSETVYLSWTASATPAIGYIIYFGDQSGVYNQQSDMGNTTSHMFAGLLSGSRKYFIIKSYDLDGNLSLASPEINVLVQ